MSNAGAQQKKKKRVVILGGGFGGVYAAEALEKERGNRDDFDIVIVNRENYFVYQPMLAEVVSGNLGILDTVSPIRRLAPKSDLEVRDVQSIDVEHKTITLSPGVRPHPHVIEYDYLLIALGNVTDFRGMPGLHEHALPFKNLADALNLRNHLIHVLEEADIERDPDVKKSLLTFVVAGGGFSGTEVVAEIYDFVHEVAEMYQDIDPNDIKVVLLHAGERVLEMELSEKLSKYAHSILQKRGIEIRTKTFLVAGTPEHAIVDSGDRISTKTLVSTVPAFPNPIIDALPLPKERGKVKADLGMQVEGRDDIWAVGDCALIPNPTGKGFCPPTAQHALREGRTAAKNIVATIRGTPKVEFKFKGLGKMGLLGHHCAVAELFDMIHLSGWPAWMIWRFVYWAKLPGIDRKFKVAVSWLLDMLFPPDLVQLKVSYRKGLREAHYEPGDIVFRQGDIGNSLYIILKGEAEVVHQENGSEQVLANLEAGEFFGEMALLSEQQRVATIRCVKSMDVLTVPRSDFIGLITNLPALRNNIEEIMHKRMEETKKIIGKD